MGSVAVGDTQPELELGVLGVRNRKF